MAPLCLNTSRDSHTTPGRKLSSCKDALPLFLHHRLPSPWELTLHSEPFRGPNCTLFFQGPCLCSRSLGMENCSLLLYLQSPVHPLGSAQTSAEGGTCLDQTPTPLAEFVTYCLCSYRTLCPNHYNNTKWAVFVCRDTWVKSVALDFRQTWGWNQNPQLTGWTWKLFWVLVA